MSKIKLYWASPCLSDSNEIITCEQISGLNCLIVRKPVYMQHRKLLKLLFLIFVFVKTSTNVFGQGTTQEQQASNIKWLLDATVENVSCYHSIVECNGRKVVFLKFNNKNAYQVKISWKEVFDTQKDAQIEGFLGQKNIVIPTGETLEVNCTQPSKKQLLILPEQVEPTYLVKISKFNYKGVSVTRVK